MSVLARDNTWSYRILHSTHLHITHLVLFSPWWLSLSNLVRHRKCRLAHDHNVTPQNGSCPVGASAYDRRGFLGAGALAALRSIVLWIGSTLALGLTHMYSLEC